MDRKMASSRNCTVGIAKPASRHQSGSGNGKPVHRYRSDDGPEIACDECVGLFSSLEKRSRITFQIDT